MADGPRELMQHLQNSAKFILNGDVLNTFSLKSQEEAETFILNTFVQHQIKGPSQDNN